MNVNSKLSNSYGNWDCGWRFLQPQFFFGRFGRRGKPQVVVTGCCCFDDDSQASINKLGWGEKVELWALNLKNLLPEAGLKICGSFVFGFQWKKSWKCYSDLHSDWQFVDQIHIWRHYALCNPLQNIWPMFFLCHFLAQVFSQLCKSFGETSRMIALEKTANVERLCGSCNWARDLASSRE